MKVHELLVSATIGLSLASQRWACEMC